jgi:DNA-binding NarL/FixJ family response regulator
MSCITILVADDHPITRTGILNILSRDAYLHVVGEASDGRQVLDMCRARHPDLVLLDVRMPQVEGLTLVQLLRKNYQAPRILMFSAYANHTLVNAALDAGADGYILKSTASNDIIEGIYRVMQGQRVLLGVKASQQKTFPPLSAQELVTLNYIAEGLSTKEIARLMNNSTRTIETYITRIFQKLDANNRTQAVTVARRHQLLLTEAN